MSAFASRFLGVWFLANLSVVVLWDLSVIAFGLDTPTVSRWLYDLGQRHPLLYLWVGIGIGHLVFPLVLSNGRPK